MHKFSLPKREKRPRAADRKEPEPQNKSSNSGKTSQNFSKTSVPPACLEVASKTLNLLQMHITSTPFPHTKEPGPLVQRPLYPHASQPLKIAPSFPTTASPATSTLSIPSANSPTEKPTPIAKPNRQQCRIAQIKEQTAHRDIIESSVSVGRSRSGRGERSTRRCARGQQQQQREVMSVCAIMKEQWCGKEEQNGLVLASSVVRESSIAV